MLTVDHVNVFHDSNHVLKGLNLQLEPDTIGCLIGASGCGKTTLLRAIAGLHRVEQGIIKIAGQAVNGDRLHVPPEQRNLGMMFQDLALFPHLTVEQNVAFGLNGRRFSEKQKRVLEVLELVEISPTRKKSFPHQLSGGQQQRVALARALAPRPNLILLDEPFSKLDLELRTQLATQVRTILKHEHVTALLVTHEQQEAFAMADIIGVMFAGEIVQWDSAYNIYHKPATRYVADFVGLGSFLPATVIDQQSVQSDFGIVHGKVPEQFSPGDKVDLLVRPDDIPHDDDSDITAIVTDKRFLGAEFLYDLTLPGGQRVQCYAPSHHNHKIGQPIGIRLEMDHLMLFKR